MPVFNRKNSFAAYLMATSFLLGSSVSPIQAESEMSLEQLQKQFEKDFSDAQTALDQAFALYQNAYNEAFDKYQKQIEAKWKAPVVSTPKVWVTYTDNFDSRSIVDFDKGRIILQSTVDDKTKDLETQVVDLLNKTYQTAYEEDVVSKEVETKLQSEPKIAEKVVVTQPSPEKVLPAVLMDTPKPTQTEIKQLAKELVAEAQVSTKTEKQGNEVRSVVIPIDLERVKNRKAKEYLESIQDYAGKERVPEPLVLAIMENESSFNPMAKSHVPAYGLMQIVPRSAGMDASAHIYGEQKLVSPSYLYTPEKNIEMGSAYLHILYYKYLKHIKNDQSRLYCTIAAYNTGAGNVAKAFTGKTKVAAAAELINQMTPDEVYNHLMKKLPYDETKNYLRKVNKSMLKYQASPV